MLLILCHYILKMNLEVQKEIGWLVFMLIPFVSMLVVHVLIPLYFIIETVPLLQVSYNNGRMSLQHHSVMAFSEVNSVIFSNKLNQYYQIFNNVENYFNNNTTSFLQFNISNISLNNAFIFNQKIQTQDLSKNYTEPTSMWFAINSTTLNQLNVIQQSIYASYIKFQAIIRLLLMNNNPSALLSLSTYIVSHNESMFFQFPSSFDDNFTNSSANFIFPYYQQTIDNYFGSNQSLSFFYEFNQNYKNKFIFCTVMINDIISGVSCMNLDLDILGNQIEKQLTFIPSSTSSSTYYLLIPIKFQQVKEYFQLIQFNRDGTIVINKTPNISNISGNLTLNQNNNFYITRNQYDTETFQPIIFENNVGIKSTTLTLLRRNQYLQTFISNQNQFSSNINIFIVPIVVLIIIFSLISMCILKKIMNSLDDELIQVENKCKFIIDGDIHVQISEYTGTQDIQQVYDGVRIINKLHRYSTSCFFSGHYATKIMKYSETLQFISSLHYDTGYVLQNLGQSYLLMQQYEKSIQCLRQSTKIILNKIQSQYGTIDSILQKKKEKRIVANYKQLELVLIRRLFNLVHTYYIYLQTFKVQLGYRRLSVSEIQQKKNKDNLIKDALEYILLLKKSFYPEYTLFAQCVFTLFFEAKINLDSGKVQIAKSNVQKAFKISDIYINNYTEVGKKLKQKGSKYKFFHLKNKMTSYSRVHPEIVKSFRNLIKAKVLLASQKCPHSNDYQAICFLFKGLKSGLTASKINALSIIEIRQILMKLQCDRVKFKLSSTQIYRQCFSYKPLSETQTISENLRINFNQDRNDGQKDRQYILLIDCFKNISIDKEENQYFQQRAQHIYDKLVKKADRISIIKFNTLQGIKIQCSLTLKQSKELIIKKQIIDSFQQKGGVKLAENQIFEVFQKTIYRIRRLKNQKVILIFFKKINRYMEHLAYISRRQRTKRKRQTHHPINNQNRDLEQSAFMQNQTTLSHKEFLMFGEWIIQVILESGINNCKICLFCNEGDRLEQFQNYFGLEQINKRLWDNTKGINRDDNIVYILSSSHKSDIDRILMVKTQQSLDNHIFML